MTEEWPILREGGTVKIRFALAAFAAVVLVVTPTAFAVRPQILGSPALFIGGPTGPRTPDAMPHVGDVLWTETPTVACDPSCDPNSPDADPHVGNREVLGGTPPAGLAYQFERCSALCTVAQAKSTQKTYVVQPADVGSSIRVVFMATNLDCSYPRSYDQYQACRWDTQTLASALTPPIPAVAVVAVSPASLPGGVAGTPYSTALTATNGSGPYTFAVTSGSLPPGLSLSAGGALAGTPTKGGSYTFTVQASGSGASPGTRTYTLAIALGVAPTALPAGVTGVAYSQALSLTGATAPVVFTVADGALPPGLTLGADGVISGVPTQKGAYAFTAKATDASSAAGSATYTLTIGSPTLTAAPARLPKAVRGVAYDERLSAAGGATPYTYVRSAGRLPAGLRLASSGAITGVPTGAAPGTYSITVHVTDRYGAEATLTFTLKYIAPTISVGPTSITGARVGSSFAVQLYASGGRGPYRFAVFSGALPPGLTLRRNGTLRGVATRAGTYRFKVRATDKDGAFKDRAYVLTVSR